MYELILIPLKGLFFFLKVPAAISTDRAGINSTLNTALPAIVPTPIENTGFLRRRTEIKTVQNSGKLEGIA